LFHTLRFAEQIDPDFLHVLALSAGLRDEALSYGKAAAERANASLAFERAAEVYERCIELAAAGEVAELWTKLALARGRCGRGVQAADAYLEAAKRVPARTAVALTQMAAAHLLRSGHFEQGEALATKVVADMRISIPASDRGVRAALVWERARLKLRGLECELRAPELVPAELLAQHDMFENLGSVFFNIDPSRASLFYLRGLHSALEAGEPSRLVLALCRVATGAAISASSGAARESEALLVRAEKLASASATHAQAAIMPTRVFASYFFGHHMQVIDFSETALHALRTDPHADTRGNYYRRHVVAAMRVGSLYVLGRYQEMTSELGLLLDEARATDNRALILTIAAAHVHMEEILDVSAATRSRLEQQARELPKNRFGTIHVVHMMAVVSAACFVGDYALAAECLDMHWDRFMGSSISRSGWLRLALHAARARLLLNQHVTAGADRALLAAVREDWTWLSKQGASHAAKRVAARLAHVSGDVPKAIQCLREAISELEAQSMVGEAARDRYALGALLAGDNGRALCETSLRQLQALGVVNPRRLLRAHYPEFIEAE
jgi:tetratricopeptide (TPR) repeat protein